LKLRYFGIHGFKANGLVQHSLRATPQELGKHLVFLANGHIHPGMEWIDYGRWPN